MPLLWNMVYCRYAPFTDSIKHMLPMEWAFFLLKYTISEHVTICPVTSKNITQMSFLIRVIFFVSRFSQRLLRETLIIYTIPILYQDVCYSYLYFTRSGSCILRNRFYEHYIGHDWFYLLAIHRAGIVWTCEILQWLPMLS